jgi:hypothetical protein
MRGLGFCWSLSRWWCDCFLACSLGVCWLVCYWFCSVIGFVVSGCKPGLGPAAEALVLLLRQKKSTQKKRRPCLCAACGGSQSAGQKNGQKRTRPFWACGPNGARTTFLLYPFFSPALWRKRRAGERNTGSTCRCAARPSEFGEWHAHEFATRDDLGTPRVKTYKDGPRSGTLTRLPTPAVLAGLSSAGARGKRQARCLRR